MASIWFNDDQCGGHDEVGAIISAIVGPLRRGKLPNINDALRLHAEITKERAKFYARIQRLEATIEFQKAELAKLQSLDVITLSQSIQLKDK